MAVLTNKPLKKGEYEPTTLFLWPIIHYIYIGQSPPRTNCYQHYDKIKDVGQKGSKTQKSSSKKSLDARIRI